MQSKFRSHCPFCHQAINIGDEIDKRNGKWGHSSCPSPTMNIPSGASHGDIPEDDTEPIQSKPFTPSHYQEAVFEHVKHSTEHAVVEAVAGSGKTTTVVQALQFTKPSDDVAFIAVNKHIADELKKRAPSHVHTSTLHSLGYSNMRQAFGKVRVDDRKVDNILDDFLPYDPNDPQESLNKRSAMKRLVSLGKAVLIDENDPIAVQAMADRYGLELNGETDSVIDLLPKVMRRSREQTNVVDFDDMIYLPIALNLSLKKFDRLFVDETQDLNKSQLEFVLGSIREKGQIVAVGDRNQSIYSFRGADSEAIPNIISALNAKTLPLSITYRCPVSHVRLAQQLVSHLEARDNAPEGIVGEVKESQLAEARDGDMILCRVNAPLVPIAFSLIRQGVKATVRGRDIGSNLASLARKLAKDTTLMSQFYSNLSDYESRELGRLEGRKASEMQVQSVLDKCETLSYVASECVLPDEIARRVESIFSDDVAGVVLSSVHRAKGLESDRVYILRPELMPHPLAKSAWEREQELNCQYVSWTRSRSELYFVATESKKR